MKLQKHIALDPTPFNPNEALKHFPNRYELTLAAATRARELSLGQRATVPSDNKEGVTALREIAAGKIGPQILEKVASARCYQRRWDK